MTQCFCILPLKPAGDTCQIRYIPEQLASLLSARFGPFLFVQKPLRIITVSDLMVSVAVTSIFELKLLKACVWTIYCWNFAGELRLWALQKFMNQWTFLSMGTVPDFLPHVSRKMSPLNGFYVQVYPSLLLPDCCISAVCKWARAPIAKSRDIVLVATEILSLRLRFISAVAVIYNLQRSSSSYVRGVLKNLGSDQHRLHKASTIANRFLQIFRSVITCHMTSSCCITCYKTQQGVGPI